MSKTVKEILETMHLKGRKNHNGYGEALYEAVEAINQLIIEAKIEEIDWSLSSPYGGQRGGNELREKRTDLQQSLKESKK